jgi:hypothetical protein
MILFQITTSFSENSENRQEEPARVQLLLIIDFGDFMCFSCLESFLQFCYSLPHQFQDQYVWGVVIFDGNIGSESEDIAVKIVEKKIRGFRKANKVRFPILVDRSHIFSSLADKGTTVLILKGEAQEVEQYTFPLSREQIAEIHKSIGI